MPDDRKRDLPASEDPLRQATRYDVEVRPANAAFGWIVGAVFAVVALGAALFSVGHFPIASMNTATNLMMPPAVRHTAPDANSPATAVFTPGPRNTTQPQN